MKDKIGQESTPILDKHWDRQGKRTVYEENRVGEEKEEMIYESFLEHQIDNYEDGIFNNYGFLGNACLKVSQCVSYIVGVCLVKWESTLNISGESQT